MFQKQREEMGIWGVMCVGLIAVWFLLTIDGCSAQYGRMRTWVHPNKDGYEGYVDMGIQLAPGDYKVIIKFKHQDPCCLFNPSVQVTGYRMYTPKPEKEVLANSFSKLCGERGPVLVVPFSIKESCSVNVRVFHGSIGSFPFDTEIDIQDISTGNSEGGNTTCSKKSPW